MIENRKNLIAKAFREKGFYNFWEFVLDKGQELEYGDFRIPAYRLVNLDELKHILKEEKKRLSVYNRKSKASCRESGSSKCYSIAKKQRNNKSVCCDLKF